MKKILILILIVLSTLSTTFAAILEDQYNVREINLKNEEWMLYSLNYNKEDELEIIANSRQEILDKTNYWWWNDYIVSPDGKSSALIKYKEDWLHMYVLKDWVESSLYDYVKSFKYSQDSQNSAFLVNKDWKEIIIKNWVESKKYDTIWEYIFSPDSKNFVFEASKDWQRVFVKNWIESIKYGGIEHLTYSPDSQKFAFVILKNWNRNVVMNWIESKPYNGFIHSIVFSPYSNKFAIITETNGKFGAFEYSVKNWVTALNKVETLNNPYQLTNDLTTQDKIKWIAIFNKIKKIISSKQWQEKITQEKIIKLLNTYKVKTKNLKTKQLVNFIITCILESNY